MRRAWQIAAQSPHLPIVAYLVFVGASSLTTGTRAAPEDLAAAVPTWLVWAWTLSLTLGGLAAFVGCVTERSRAESFGLAFCLSGMFLYVIAYASGAPAVAALALMCASRLWALHQARKTHAVALRIIDRGAA